MPCAGWPPARQPCHERPELRAPDVGLRRKQERIAAGLAQPGDLSEDAHVSESAVGGRVQRPLADGLVESPLLGGHLDAQRDLGLRRAFVEDCGLRAPEDERSDEAPQAAPGGLVAVLVDRVGELGVELLGPGSRERSKRSLTSPRDTARRPGRSRGRAFIRAKRSRSFLWTARRSRRVQDAAVVSFQYRGFFGSFRRSILWRAFRCFCRRTCFAISGATASASLRSTSTSDRTGVSSRAARSLLKSWPSVVLA